MTKCQVLSGVSGIKIYPPPGPLSLHPLYGEEWRRGELSAQPHQHGEGARNCRQTFGGSSRHPSLGAAAVEPRVLKVAGHITRF
jgi:hypothetical protein